MDMATSTILSALIAAVVGGGLGSLISARSNITLAREARRDRASAALWDYQRTLAGYATKLYDESGAWDETAFIGTADLKAVREAYKVAYPWAGYLKPEVRKKVLREASFDIELPPRGPADLTAAESVDRLAIALAADLERAFPLK